MVRFTWSKLYSEYYFENKLSASFLRTEQFRLLRQTYSNYLGSNLINLYYYWSSHNLEYCWFERQLCDLIKLAREPLWAMNWITKRAKHRYHLAISETELRWKHTYSWHNTALNTNTTWIKIQRLQISANKAELLSFVQHNLLGTIPYFSTNCVSIYTLGTSLDHVCRELI